MNRLLLSLAAASLLLPARLHAGAPELPTPPILPREVYGLKGTPCVIRLDHLVYTPIPGSLLYDATGPGAQYNERLLWHPKESVEGKPLKVVISSGRDFKPLAEIQTQFIYCDPASVTAKGKVRWLAIGDSLTLPGHYVVQTRATLEKSLPGVVLEPVGTQHPKDDPSLRHEGRGGWSWGRYLEGGGAAAPSPFVFGGQFDFARYLKEHHQGQAPEVITLFLGANDVYGSAADFDPAKIDLILERAQQVVAHVRRAAPQSVIGIIPPPPPSEQNGFGTNYQNGVTQWQYRRAMQHYIAGLLKAFDGRTEERIYIVPGYLAFDPATAYPIASGRAQNALHPTPEGYQPISNALSAWWVHLLANGIVKPQP